MSKHYGDFLIKESDREMVYIGGGAGMAPLRSHISYLFETLKTKRILSFWYGARSLRELYYREYFEKLATDHKNFRFNVALSEPEPEDRGISNKGFIHKIVQDKFLALHRNPAEAEYYICGPPEMVSACHEMLKEYEIEEDHISFDEF